MNHHLKNTAAVLLATGLTALAIFATVQTTAVLAGVSGTASNYASTSAGNTGTFTCPRTGCTSSYCHATGQSAGSNGSAGSGISGGSSGGGSQEPLTCPRTGCTASSCHASSGGGRGGGSGNGYGGYGGGSASSGTWQ